MGKVSKGHKFNCITKFNVGDIVYMRSKNCKDQYVKQGPIKIMGIELRVDSKGNEQVWYNCHSANFYKFAFYSKGKNYVKEKDLYTEAEVDEMGWDVESVGYTDSYKPDGTPKTEDEIWEDTLAKRKAAGEKVKLVKTPNRIAIVQEE